MQMTRGVVLTPASTHHGGFMQVQLSAPTGATSVYQ